MRIIFLLILVFTQLNASAQKQNIRGQSLEKISNKTFQWHYGDVVFNNNDTLRCEFAYNPLILEGVIQIKDNDQLLTYGPRHIKGFSFNEDVERRFLVFSVVDTDSYNTQPYQCFFEVVFHNQKISVLAKEILYIDGSDDYNTMFNRLRNINLLFLAEMEKRILHDYSKKSLLKLTKNKETEVEEFIKTNNLKFKKDPADFQKVIEYYSSIQ